MLAVSALAGGLARSASDFNPGRAIQAASRESFPPVLHERDGWHPEGPSSRPRPSLPCSARTKPGHARRALPARHATDRHAAVGESSRGCREPRDLVGYELPQVALPVSSIRRRGGALRYLAAAGLIACLALWGAPEAGARTFRPQHHRIFHGVTDTGHVRDYRVFNRRVRAHNALLMD